MKSASKIILIYMRHVLNAKQRSKMNDKMKETINKCKKQPEKQ